MKELAEDADREKALKDVANATAKEKSKAYQGHQEKGLVLGERPTSGRGEIDRGGGQTGGC